MTIIIFYTVTTRSGIKRQAAGRFKDIKAFIDYTKEATELCGWEKAEVDKMTDTLNTNLELA
jgi:ribosome modulation factor